MPQVGTLSGNPVAAVAGLATLAVLRHPGAYEAYLRQWPGHPRWACGRFARRWDRGDGAWRTADVRRGVQCRTGPQLPGFHQRRRGFEQAVQCDGSGSRACSKATTRSMCRWRMTRQTSHLPQPLSTRPHARCSAYGSRHFTSPVRGPSPALDSWGRAYAACGTAGRCEVHPRRAGRMEQKRDRHRPQADPGRTRHKARNSFPRCRTAIPRPPARAPCPGWRPSPPRRRRCP